MQAVAQGTGDTGQVSLPWGLHLVNLISAQENCALTAIFPLLQNMFIFFLIFFFEPTNIHL